MMRAVVRLTVLALLAHGCLPVLAAEPDTALIEQQRRAVDARSRQINDLRTRLSAGERAQRVATYEAALGGNDVALRQIAMEAALQGRDPILANLALRDWLSRRRTVPVQLFATKEEPASETVLRNIGPLTLELEAFNATSGAFTGTLGAPGYDVTQPSPVIGALARTELTANARGCALTLRLTEHQTMDGLLRCQTLPALIARVTVD